MASTVDREKALIEKLVGFVPYGPSQAEVAAE